MTGHKGFVILEAFLLISASPAWATPITFEFTGTVTGTFDPDGFFDPSIIVGETFTGSYTFNSDVVDRNDDPRYGRFVYSQPAPEGFSMKATIGNVIFDSINVGSIATDNLITGDPYQVATNIDPLGFDRASMKFAAGGVTGMFDSDALPLVPPDLNQIGINGSFSIDYRFRPGSLYNATAYGTLTSLTHVPEPATMLLLGLGGLIVRRKL